MIDTRLRPVQKTCETWKDLQVRSARSPEADQGQRIASPIVIIHPERQRALRKRRFLIARSCLVVRGTGITTSPDTSSNVAKSSSNSLKLREPRFGREVNHSTVNQHTSPTNRIPIPVAFCRSSLRSIQAGDNHPKSQSLRFMERCL